MADVTGYWLGFDGTDDTVSFADDATYDVTSALSVFGWVIRDYEDASSTWISRASTFSLDFGAHDELIATVYGVTAVTSRVSFPRQEVMSIGVVMAENGTGLYVKFYKNGLLVDTQSVASSAFPAATNTSLYFGSTAGSSAFFQGKMANILLASDVVTDAEMLTLHQNGNLTQDVALIDNDFIGIPFNEGSGTTLDNDSTAGLDGTIAGTELWRTHEGLHLSDDNTMVAKYEGERFYGDVFVNTIELVAPTTVAHLAEVTDWDGRPIGFNDKCAVANTGNGQKYIGHICNGLKVSDLDSGYLVINYR